jgi:predicted DNA-binding ribbon-helix-helix protein
MQAMDRTVIALPAGLHFRAKALAQSRNMSLAALIRAVLEESAGPSAVQRISKPRAAYVAAPVRNEEEDAMKRIVISLPQDIHERLREMRTESGMSMAALVRSLLDERTRRERPKPRFGAFASGYTDTGHLAGEMPYEPRSWR